MEEELVTWTKWGERRGYIDGKCYLCYNIVRRYRMTISIDDVN